MSLLCKAHFPENLNNGRFFPQYNHSSDEAHNNITAHLGITLNGHAYLGRHTIPYTGKNAHHSPNGNTTGVLLGHKQQLSQGISEGTMACNAKVSKFGVEGPESHHSLLNVHIK